MGAIRGKRNSSLIISVIPLFALFSSATLQAGPIQSPIQIFKNRNCETTHSCDLKEFQLETLPYQTVDADTFRMQGTNMIASYRTRDISQLRNYVIVQFVRGCVFGSLLTDGKVTPYFNVRREYFGLKDYIFHQPNWVVDSFDLDPAYGSEDLGRHSGYLNVKPELPIDPSQLWRRDYFQIADPREPELYAYDSPTSGQIDESGPKSEWTPTNTSLEFKTCIFKSQDVPARVLPSWDGRGKALHCFRWSNSAVFDFKSEAFVSPVDIEPYCLTPRLSKDEMSEDAQVIRNAQAPLPPGFQLEGKRDVGFWQPQIPVTKVGTTELPESEIQSMLSGRMFTNARGIRYVPRYQDSRTLSKQVQLNLLIEAGTNWDRPGVAMEQIQRVAQIYTQCGVRLSHVDALTAEFQPDARQMLKANPDPYSPPLNVGLMPDIRIPRPYAVLFGDEDPNSIYSVNQSSVDSLPDRAPLLNTAWLTQGAIHHLGDAAWKQGYSALAHEFVHILGNVGHVYFRDPNLMSSAFVGSKGKSGDLTPGQCKAIRQFQ